METTDAAASFSIGDGMRLEILRERLAAYYAAELAILRGQEYQLDSRRLRRADLSAVRAAIRELEEEIALLEQNGRRVRRVTFIE